MDIDTQERKYEGYFQSENNLSIRGRLTASRKGQNVLLSGLFEGPFYKGHTLQEALVLRDLEMKNETITLELTSIDMDKPFICNYRVLTPLYDFGRAFLNPLAC
jgi:hypothetical protein